MFLQNLNSSLFQRRTNEAFFDSKWKAKYVSILLWNMFSENKYKSWLKQYAQNDLYSYPLFIITFLL